MAIEKFKQPSRGIQVHVAIPRMDRAMLDNEILVDIYGSRSKSQSGVLIRFVYFAPAIAYVLARRRLASVEA